MARHTADGGMHIVILDSRKKNCVTQNDITYKRDSNLVCLWCTADANQQKNGRVWECWMDNIHVELFVSRLRWLQLSYKWILFFMSSAAEANFSYCHLFELHSQQQMPSYRFPPIENVNWHLCWSVRFGWWSNHRPCENQKHITKFG